MRDKRARNLEPSGTPMPARGELAEFETDFTIERFTQRDLMLDLGAVLWFAMGLIAALSGQFDPAPESQLQTIFRFVVAIGSIVFVFLLLTAVRRLDDERTKTVLAGGSFLALFILFALSFYGPGAVGAMMVGCTAIVIYASQFLAVRGLTALLACLSVLSAVTAANWYGDPATHYIASNTVLLVMVLWATGFSVFILSRDRIEALEEAERAAFSDALTGLPNTRMLRRRIEPLLEARNERIHGRTAVTVLDLDGFRTANMLRGHREGDRLLRMVADAMTGAARSDQIVARTGSDEFTVLTPNAGRERLEELEDQFRAAVLEALAGEVGRGVNIDASVGSAISGPECTTFRELMRSADQRMYLDKATHDPHEIARKEEDAEEVASWTLLAKPAPRNLSRWDRLRWSNQPSQVRFTSIAWSLSAIAAAIALHVPDAIEHKDPLFTILILISFALAAGRYLSRPSTRLWQQIADVVVACVMLALAIYATGGSASALWPSALLVFIYVGWFVPLEWAPWTFLGAMVILLAPVPFEDNGGGLVLMDAVTIFGGIIVSFALLAILYYNHYYVDRAQILTSQLSSLDPRAGAYNRRAFEERMSEELDRLSYGDRDALAVVMVDLGNFKSVSANYGRVIGDQLLAEVADALGAASREEDCVARLGGDEFAIVAPGVDAESARALAERLIAAVRAAIEQSDLPSNEEVRPSAGFALYGMHGRTTDELVTAADVALTAAKTSSRDPNRVSSFVVAL